MAIFILSILITAPLFIYFFLTKNMKKLKSPEFIIKYGTLYEGFKDDYGPAIYYYIIFKVRRIIFAASTVFLSGYPCF
jgi:hypothetical protein